MILLMAKYARDIPAILECVDKGYQIHTFFDSWEIKWRTTPQGAIGPTIREALEKFKTEVVATYIDPELG